MTSTTQFDLPPNVPPSLVVDLDMYNLPGAADDPQLAWRAFSSTGDPVVYSP
jgi:hypothetical protein